MFFLIIGKIGYWRGKVALSKTVKSITRRFSPISYHHFTFHFFISNTSLPTQAESSWCSGSPLSARNSCLLTAPLHISAITAMVQRPTPVEYNSIFQAKVSCVCFSWVFSWSGDNEGQFLIKAHWHIDPQTAPGGQSPLQPLQMLSQEINSKPSCLFSFCVSAAPTCPCPTPLRSKFST